MVLLSNGVLAADGGVRKARMAKRGERPPGRTRGKQLQQRLLRQELSKAVDAAEKVVVAGGGGVGFYGTLQMRCLKRLWREMKQQLGLDNESVIFDAGFGVGRMAMLVHGYAPKAQVRGVEIDATKMDKARLFLGVVKDRLAARGMRVPDVRVESTVAARNALVQGRHTRRAVALAGQQAAALLRRFGARHRAGGP